MIITKTKSRTRIRSNAGHRLAACLLVLLFACIAVQRASTQTRQTASSVGGLLNVQDVVDNLIAMNLRRAQALHSYRGTRIYRAEYRSPLKSLSAEMVVDVNYQAPQTKQFTIKSYSGSRLIIDRVFRKILQAEEDALSTDSQRTTALNWANYNFKLLGYESTTLHPRYVLAVEPRTKNKFLFRGKIWISANDFAVMRIEAEPAKNPSFWTKNNEIEQSYTKIDGFWLPERNHSSSSIRIGGQAELNIDYQNYRITAADSIRAMSAGETARSGDTE